jgi:tetratricopeptide (TPR) repeat protein
VLGCGNAFKNSWTDFRAYYNTYYNAQENYRAGIKKIEEQPITIDPTEPVRIHPAPIQAGHTDFQKAIDKGARILRKFPGSKWADDAILLIGKSYYYRQEFYPALRKFEELRNASTSSKMEQSAIIWKGRTQLDLKLYSEGASFLESELNLYPNDWSTERKAEIQALAAEHYAMLENWEQAANLLSTAVTEIKNKELLGRTLFLYGQILERLERYGEAHFAFSRVPENFPGFEYTFWARFKEADVARKEKNLDQAIAIYKELRNDDKNFQRRNELTYEIARTLEMKGEAETAEELYKGLLYGNRTQQQRSLKADIYYRLGKIYSDQYNNYSIASAYFDSSSTISDAPKKTDGTQDAKTLADAFGEYTRLQQSISRADSLLWLGSLSETQLDSALEKIRMQKRKKLLKEQESKSQNILANKKLAGDGDRSTSSGSFGFLNYQNSRLVNQVKGEFRIVWGNRPLIDNWRRMEVVRRSSVSSLQPGQQKAGNESTAEEHGVIDLNLEEIPRTSEEVNQLEVEKANAQYELGNLLFLNLNLPDSAAHYYREVIKNEAGQELHPRAMYSLFELFSSRQNQDSLQFWGKRILNEYPNSRFARRVKARLEGTQETNKSIEQDSSDTLIQQYQQIISSEEPGKASKLRELALENRHSELAPYIHYKSIESFIREAKIRTELPDSINSSTAGEMPHDSMSVDTTGSVSNNRLSFQGARWDSVRLAVEEFDTTFPQAKQHKKVIKIRELLSKPNRAVNMPTCESLGISLTIKPSMDDFLATVEYPEGLQGTSISGELVYSFVVNEAGDVKSYSLVSPKTSLGIEEALEKAFQQSLYFEPLKLENPPESIKCEVSFPIQR